MSVTARILQLATQLADSATRSVAARELGVVLGGDSVLVFVRDEEIDQLLTAPGMTQRLPNGRAWRDFLKRTIERGRNHDMLPVTRADERLPVVGIAATSDVVIVLVGTHTPAVAIEEVRALLPLIAAAFRAEREAEVAAANAKLAKESIEKAEALTEALASTNRQLNSANAELRRQAVALESANDELRDQAALLEAQTIELETQAEELSETNAELVAAREAAEQASRAKSEFLTTMSHELRTPLNAISGYVQLLQMGIHGPLSEPQRAALDRVHRSQTHLLRLINDILSLARIEAGGVHYHFGDVLLQESITNILPLVEPRILEKQIKFSVVPLAEDLLVKVDAEKLDQIMLNLLSNAAKFTPAAGAITVRILPDSNDPHIVLIEVEDTGPGVPPDKLEAIFDAFVQAHSGLTRKYEGTGLGLAISRDLARGMQGDLTVRSTVGVGSVFTLKLPRSSAQQGRGAAIQH